MSRRFCGSWNAHESRLPRPHHDGAAPLIGSSPAIQQVRNRIERIAATDFTMLVEGASGPQPHLISLRSSARVQSTMGTGQWRERGMIRRIEV
jgi:hypothetical protein